MGKLKVGPVEYDWDKKMKDPNLDMKFLKSQIDSWVIEIDHQDQVDISGMYNDLEKFLKIMRQYGHLARLDKEKEYQEKYFKITEFFKKQWGQGSI